MAVGRSMSFVVRLVPRISGTRHGCLSAEPLPIQQYKPARLRLLKARSVGSFGLHSPAPRLLAPAIEQVRCHQDWGLRSTPCGQRSRRTSFVSHCPTCAGTTSTAAGSAKASTVGAASGCPPAWRCRGQGSSRSRGTPPLGAGQMHRFNSQRLPEGIGYVPPAKHEAAYHRRTGEHATAV